MLISNKKLNCGFTMPEYGLGTWEMGGRKEHDPSNDDQADIKAIQEAIKLGVFHIDTAEAYADGYSEVLIAKAIKGQDRSKLFLSSKINTKNLEYEEVLSACEKSLKRLQTDYIDLYMPHGYNSAFSLKDTMRALDKLVDDRIVKNIGLSNFGVEKK